MNLQDMSLMYQAAIKKRVEAYKKNFNEFSEENFQLFRAPSISWFGLYKESVKIEAISYRIAPITRRNYFFCAMLYYFCLDLVQTLALSAVALSLLPRSGGPTGDPLVLGNIVIVAIDVASFFVYAAGHGGDWKRYTVVIDLVFFVSAVYDRKGKNSYNFLNPFYSWICLFICVVNIVCLNNEPYYPGLYWMVTLNFFALFFVQYIFAQHAPCRTVYLCESSLPKPSGKWNDDLDKKMDELLKTAEHGLEKNFVYLLYGQSEGNLVVYRLFESFKKNSIFSGLDVKKMSIKKYFGDQDNRSKNAPREKIWHSILTWLKTEKYTKEKEGQQEDFSDSNFLPKFVEKLREEMMKSSSSTEDNSSFQQRLATPGCSAQDAAEVPLTENVKIAFNPVWLFYFWDGKVPKDFWFEELKKEYDAPFINYQTQEIAIKEVDSVVRSLISEHNVQTLGLFKDKDRRAVAPAPDIEMGAILAVGNGGNP